MAEERRGRPMDAQRDQIIHETTLSTLGEVGYDALSIAQIAKGAGVSKATIYRRYPNKLELVIGSLELGIILPELPDTGSGLRDIKMMARLIITFALNDSSRCLLGCMMVARSRNPELAEAMKRRVVGPRRARGRQVLERAIRRGELPQDTELELMMDMIFGSLFIRHARGDEVTLEVADALAEAVWTGMGGSR
ncbi:MAG: TetR/AcrR family transcriptional regulator [Myxococcota bacterium]|nr:TetR/AcrR family transcriptional regulator [Myxococcota bacterium]